MTIGFLHVHVPPQLECSCFVKWFMLLCVGLTVEFPKGFSRCHQPALKLYCSKAICTSRELLKNGNRTEARCERRAQERRRETWRRTGSGNSQKICCQRCAADTPTLFSPPLAVCLPCLSSQFLGCCLCCQLLLSYSTSTCRSQIPARVS